MTYLDVTQFLEHFDEAVLVFDASGQLRHANDVAQTLVGLTETDEQPTVEEVLGEYPQLLDVYRTVRPEGAPVVTGRRQPSVEKTVEIDAADETRYFDVAVAGIAGEENPGTVLIAEDITEKRKQQRKLRERTAEFEAKNTELERQNELLDSFASFISHDLRNPLGIARMYLDFARESNAPEDFTAVEEALDRMDRMITDMLTLTRKGDMVEQTEPVDLVDLTSEAWSNVETEAATLTHDDPDTVSADVDSLLNLFENLFRNSVEHGGSDVTVTVGALDREPGFYVADDGKGIPDDKKQEILTEGFSTGGDGAGLGLAIVTAIAEAHEWAVSVDDSRDGGARFEFTVDSPADK